ncbi:MAG: tetratricopeptide repeat protein [Alphaproteobacteria bacterium]
MPYLLALFILLVASTIAEAKQPIHRPAVETPLPLAQTAESNFAQFLQKAQQGNVEAQVKIARMYQQGEGVGQNKAAAFRWWRQAAESGDRGAQTVLADLYKNGDGVAVDEKEALHWQQKAAMAGVSSAQLALGEALWAGRVIGQSRPQAFAWLMLAAGAKQEIIQRMAVEKVRLLLEDPNFKNEDLAMGAQQLAALIHKQKTVP